MPRIRWDSALTIYVLMLVSAVPLGAIMAAANPMPPGGCSGLGFGCSLYGWDGVAFVAVLFGAPYVFVLGVALLVLAKVRRRPDLARVVAWGGLVVFWVGGLLMAETG